MRLWEDARGRTVAAAFFFALSPFRRNPNLVALISEPAYSGLAVPMLEWAEEQRLSLDGEPGLALEVTESNTLLNTLLASRGYRRSDDWMNMREKPLGAGPDEVILPPGYTLKHVETDEEQHKFFLAVHAVFSMLDNPNVYAEVCRGPSHVRELGLIALSPDGEVASFCTLWLDRENGVAEFEPVGTRPEQQKRGLGLAVMAEGCNRLRALGCPLATVHGWSESPGANRLYEAGGFCTRDRLFDWQRAIAR
jgi:GNAT superfamily N-acetyltransferase